MFKRWLRAAMESSKIVSYSELARRVGRSPATVSRWANGKVLPTYDDICLLARALGVPRAEVYRALGMLPDPLGEELQLLAEFLETSPQPVREMLVMLARCVLQRERQGSNRPPLTSGQP
jgi:transcriptional regulator with XRE-family HTH domain